MSKIKLRNSSGIMHLRLSRPEKLNACDGETYNALADARHQLEENANLRVGIISGEGSDFCVGNDISWINSSNADGYLDPLYQFMMQGKKPVIAAIHGRCIGAGFEIALGCDIRICCEDARFGLGRTVLERIPGGYGTQRLPRLVPLGAALEMLYTGDPIIADDAYRLGLVNHVSKNTEDMIEKAEQIAQKIIENPPEVVEGLKTSVMDGLDMALPAAVRRGIDYYKDVIKTKLNN